jgi:hypothetical protein
MRALLLALGGIMVIASAAFSIALRSESKGLPSVLLALFFLAIGVYLLAYAARSRIIIDGPRIEVRSAFGERSANLNEIEGFRTFSTRNGTYTKLFLKDGRSGITISRSFNTDDDFRSWFAQITDLDERDEQKLLDDIAHESELGATPEERLAALATAKTWNVFAIIIALSTAAALNWGPVPFRLPAAILLALAPLVAIFMVQRSPLLYAIFKQKTDPRAELSFVFFASAFGLVFSGGGLHFVSRQSILAIAGLIGVVLFAALYVTARNGFAVPGKIIALLFISGFYGYGLASVADTLPDQSTPQPYATQVVGKHISSGRSTTYYLNLAPWGPMQGPNRISVPSEIYRRTVEGDQVCLELHSGALHVSWYKHVDCPNQPDWIPPQ